MLGESNSDCFRRLVGGANGSPSHVSNTKRCIRVLLTKVLGITILRIASATSTSVEPVHVGGHVVPERDDEGHATLHGFAKLLHATVVVEVWQLIVLVDQLVILVVVLVHAVELALLLTELS